MIAALRDRTTALLGQLTPRNLIIPPPFEALAERLSRQPVTPLWQIRLKRASLWAAGVMAAVGAGWAGRSVLDPHEAAVPLAQEQQPAGSVTALAELAPATTTLGPVALTGADSSAADPTLDLVRDAKPLPESRPRESAPQDAAVRLHRVASSPAFASVPMLRLASAINPMLDGSQELASAVLPEDKSPFGPLWEQVQWEEALEKVGSGLPYIEGFLVVGVLLRQGEPDERPTSLVAQQDPSGEIILSIEGPIEKVNELVKSQATREIHASELTRTTPDYLPLVGGGIRRNNRVLTVTGRMSVDSLNILARRATIR